MTIFSLPQPDGIASTYGCVSYDKLPSLNPVDFDPSYSWLPSIPKSSTALEFENLKIPPKETLSPLLEEAGRLGLSIPETFVRFITESKIHKRVPTCTSCYLDLGPRLVRSPVAGEGHLLRFMNDQQSVFFWYLRLMAGGRHDVLVAAPEFADESSATSIDDMVTLTDVVICAPTFEEFIRRYWLENSIWFSLHEKSPMSHEQSEYWREFCRLTGASR